MSGGDWPWGPNPTFRGWAVFEALWSCWRSFGDAVGPEAEAGVGWLHPIHEEHNLSFGERRRSSVLEPQELKWRLSQCRHCLAQISWGFPQLKPEHTLHWVLRSWVSVGWILEGWQPSVGGCSLKFLFNLTTFASLHPFLLSRDLTWIYLVFFWHHGLFLYTSEQLGETGRVTNVSPESDSRIDVLRQFLLSSGWSQERQKDFCFWNWILCDYYYYYY